VHDFAFTGRRTLSDSQAIEIPPLASPDGGSTKYCRRSVCVLGCGLASTRTTSSFGSYSSARCWSQFLFKISVQLSAPGMAKNAYLPASTSVPLTSTAPLNSTLVALLAPATQILPKG